MNNSQKTFELGQSIWYDNIQRKLLENGEMQRMVDEGLIYGVTSNPSIFNAAIGKSNEYDDDLIPLAQAGKSAAEIFDALAAEDIRATADLLRGHYDRTGGADGYVSLEVNPTLANESAATTAEARRLWNLVDRPNLMVKIPATEEGLPAIQQSTAAGININITLIFSRQRYAEVMDAYLAGLEARIEAGEPINQIHSVASFFVSRIDSNVDARLDALIAEEGAGAAKAAELRGKAAIANAKLAYQLFREVFGSARFAALEAVGGNVQRPLWASTSTKNPSYPDTLYIDELIGPQTVNTVPPNTLDAFNAHGTVAYTLDQGLGEAQAVMDDLATLGISMDEVTHELEEQGVRAFSQAFAQLMETVEERRAAA
jgi:transaldolase